MNKPMMLVRLACLTVTLAAGSVLMTTDIASAKENYQQGASHVKQRPASDAKRYGLRPQFVISGQPVNVKRVLHQCYHHHHKHCYPRYRPLQAAPKGNPIPLTAGSTVPTASAR